VIFAWQGSDGDRVLVTVNFADHQSQCYVCLPFAELAGQSARLTDLMGSAVFDRDGHDVLSRGMYLDVPAWGYHVFEIS
jgi:hypothetical protein